MPLTAMDRCELLDLYSRGTRLIADGDAQGWADLFTRDGVFAMPAIEAFGTEATEIRGTEALKAYIGEVIAGTFDSQMGLPPGVKKKYLTTNVILEEGDGETAEGSAYLLIVVLEPGNSPRFLSSGTYSDRFVKTDTGWKFALRQLTPDI